MWLDHASRVPIIMSAYLVKFQLQRSTNITVLRHDRENEEELRNSMLREASTRVPILDTLQELLVES